MLVVAAVVVTVAVIASVALAPLASVPTVHRPVLEVYVGALGTDVTKLRPAGNRSVICTPVAVLGPLFVAVTVNVTWLPRLGVRFDTVLVIAMSAACPVTVAEAVLLPATGSGSVSAVLVAVLVTEVVPVTVATIERVAFPPLATAPTIHTPVPEV